MEMSEECVLCFDTSNVERVNFQVDADGLAGMVALHLPFVQIAIKPDDPCCLECLTELISFRNFFDKIKAVHMKTEIEDFIEFEEPMFEQPKEIEALYLPQASSTNKTASASSTSKRASASSSKLAPASSTKPATARTPLKPVFRFPDPRQKYFDAEVFKDFVDMSCDLCKKTGKTVEFKTFVEAHKHYKDVHDQQGYLICCATKFKSRYGLLEHVLRHRNPEKYKCHICGKNSANASNLKHHIGKFHLYPDRYKCDKCSATFNDKPKLTYHVRKQHAPANAKPARKERAPPSKLPEEGKFFCEICGKQMRTQSYLRKHLKNVHTDPSERVECQICGHFLKNEFHLNKHLERHKEAELELKCDLCDKKCNTRAALRLHRHRKHFMPNNFACSFCEKKFKQQIDLTEHEATHRGIDLYQCAWCPAAFKFGGSFRAHRKNVHPEEYEKIKPAWLRANL